MRKPVILVTGASGEIGNGIIDYFSQIGEHDVIALDLRPFEPDLAAKCLRTVVGDILDTDLLERLISKYEIHQVYHLAALLSTRAEFTPARAHRVNVEGTLNLLLLAHEQARWHGHTVKFLFPSSIAAYGLPDVETKTRTGKINEDSFNKPTTMYGCNKLYCEHLGRYFTLHFRQLAKDSGPSGVDFRAIRFPGLISALTVPSGGTSDFAPEMLHAAARGEPYQCFVAENATLPFMAMPDAIKALKLLAGAPASALRRRVYNVGAFSLTAGELKKRVLGAFPETQISFSPDDRRAGIVDSWPADVDDTPAREDWGWAPDYDEKKAFSEYLVPMIREFYRKRRSGSVEPTPDESEG